MLYTTKRELLEGLIVAELVAKRGQGPLARRHFPLGGRGPAGGVSARVDRPSVLRADGLVAESKSEEPPRSTSRDEEPR
jgi:hypothetical protein